MKQDIIKSLPTVSIIVACYNHEEFVIETLNSIRDDSYPNKEIVIINDGSKDNSDKLIKRWVEENKDNLSIFYKYRENKGVNYTLNELLATASGKYILPIASDDFLVKDMIAPRVEILENEPDKLVLLSDCHVIDRNRNLLFESCLKDRHKRNKETYKDDKGILKEMILTFSIAGPVVIYNKKIFSVIGNYPANGHVEDWFFYQRAACKNLILFWDRVVSFYRLHDNNHDSKNLDNLVRRKLIKQSILNTVIRNWPWYPGIYKLVGIKLIASHIYHYLKSKILSSK